MVDAVLEEGLTWKQAAACFHVSERTVAKWVARYRREGVQGLQDRSSRPALSPSQTSNAQVAVVLALRRMRLPGFQIARQTGLSKATVSRLLAAHGPSKLSALEPAKPVVRYQRQLPGELLHSDIDNSVRHSNEVVVVEVWVDDSALQMRAHGGAAKELPPPRLRQLFEFTPGR